LEIATFTIRHEQVNGPTAWVMRVAEGTKELDDVRVLEMLQNFGLTHGVFCRLGIFLEAGSFQHAFPAGRSVSDKQCLAKRSPANSFHLRKVRQSSIRETTST
jgi:hypothetical protein